MPKPAAKVAPKPEPPKPVMWFMKSEEGEDYGPIARSVLDAWHAEGRLTADCQVLQVGTEQWQWASDLYRDLAAEEPAAASQPASAPATRPAPDEPEADEPWDEDDDEQDDEPPPRRKRNRPAATKARRSKPAAAPRHPVRRGAKKVFSPPPDEDEDDEDWGEDEEFDDGEMSTRSRLAAGLLGIFLGPLGIHRFYLGYIGIGLAMLFTLGGCGIWSLTDAILVCLGRIVDAEGRPLAE